MPYSEENGQVVLRMSQEDYELLLMTLGAGMGSRIFEPTRMLAFVNRLNEGNPNYTPYQVPEKKP
jgi:hypothetical protein